MKKANPWLLPVALLVCMGACLCLRAEQAQQVTLQLKNGDRLTGQVLSEDANGIVLETPWNIAIHVPKSEIEQQVATVPNETLIRDTAQPPAEAARAQPAPLSPTSDVTARGADIAAVKTKPSKAVSPAAKQPQQLKWNLKLGTDVVKGAKNRTIYFGQTALTYTRNYERNPREFLRNKIEYRVDYGETDGRVSANRMVGANKLDFDIGLGYYGYAALGAGYDKVRKIDYQYEIGPGLGYHLIAVKSFVLDAELGLNYQYREGLDDAPNREAIQLRMGQELTWEVVPKITLTEQLAFLPFLDELGEYQIRLEGNLGFGIVRYLSLNLTVLNLYDTLPAPGVPNNELQFRSSLGVTF